MALRLSLVLALLVTGCRFEVDYRGTSVTCAGASDCPQGACSRTLGRCVPLGLETEPPRLTLVEALSPVLGRAGTVFSFTLESDEALDRLPAVEASFDRGGLVVFTTADPLESQRWQFSWEAPADAPQGTARVRASAIDLAGNEGTLEQPPTFLIDTRPPQPGLAGVSLFPPPGSRLVTVDALSPPGRALVSFTFDEPIDGGVSLTASPPVLDCQQVRIATGQQAFSCVLDGGAGQEGLIALSVEATDVVGNRGVTALTLVPPLRFDTIPPPLEADAGLLHLRVPVANGQGAPQQRVTGGPGTTEPGAFVQLFLATSSLELARGFAGDAGELDIELTPGTDRTEVSVLAIDTAGNLSPIVPVRRVEFHAVPGPANANATSAVVMGAASPRLERAELVPISGAALTRADGIGLSIDGRPSWLKRSTGSPPQSGSAIDTAIAFDEARATLVGQVATSFVFFNGRDFSRPISVPVARGNAAMSYDRRRGVMVVWGGTAALANEVVEVRGDQTLRTVQTAAGPSPARTRHVLVWDGVGTQLLGGSPATGVGWRWDGQRWSRLDAGTMPMNVVVAAYDPRRDEVLALASRDGGSPETWRHDALGWGLLAVDGGPPTSAGSMVWDVANDRALFNGNLSDGGAQVYAFQRGAWAFVRAGLPTLRSPGASTYSLLSNEWLALAGTSRAELFAFDADAGWVTRRRAQSEVLPANLADFGGAWLGGQLVVNGGYVQNGPVLDTTWRWDGTGWTAAGLSPLPMQGHQLVALPARNEVVVVGGANALVGGLMTSAWRIALLPDGGWPLDAGWEELPDAGPGTRTRPTFVATSPSEALLFGGSSTNSAWRYDGVFSPVAAPAFGARWRMAASLEPGVGLLSTAGAPMASGIPTPDGPLWLGTAFERLDGGLSRGRSLHTSVFDTSRREHLVFGGLVEVAAGESAIADVVRVAIVDGGVSVTLDQPDDPEADGNPSVRHSHLAGWDDARARMVVFGGRNNARNENDVWEYLTEQNRPALVTSIDTAQLNVEGVRAFTLAVTLTAGGDGEVMGRLTPGVVVEVFQAGRWEPIGEVQGSADQPGATVITFTSSTPGLVWSALNRLAIRLTPKGANGRSFARLFVDELDVTVRFTRE